MNAGFVATVLAYLLRGRLSFSGGHRPPVGHVVPEAFAGVGVAASSDAAVDDWIVEKLQAAGIRNVRLDFTYGDQQGDAGRLLRRLLDARFHVVLHLLQPLTAAQEMPGDDACDVWRQFIGETLDEFGGRVTMVEVCSTINRKRWCGYSLASFYTAWDIAWHEVKRRGLVLAGPSVTDFEPLWSIGVLANLQRRGRLPDVHTDNLFAERATEPERDDPKVLGQRFAGLLRMTLVKKARLLQRIGADFGVPRLFSPAAFWTLPRIQRRLPAGEQKQADYLARYMVLAAASGALEAAWWGPLICHREGLVDDGVAQYPARERITHYAAVDGALTDFLVRPAFCALRTFNERVPGQQYLGSLAGGKGLEVHAFTAADGGLIHVGWTINGRAAALVDVYQPEDLADAVFHSRDGDRLLEAPTLFTESPFYISWSIRRKIDLKQGAALLPGVAIDVHGARVHHFFRSHEWQGIIAAACADDVRRLLAAVRPDLLAVRHDAVMRHARNAIWSIADPRDPVGRLIVKQPVKISLYKRLLDRFKPSKALRSWSGTNELLRRGIGVAQPVAYFEKCDGGGLTQNYYLCEYVSGGVSVREMVLAFARGDSDFLGADEASAWRQLCQFLILMHGRGIHFRDLSGGNILIGSEGEGRLVFSLIDTGRLRAYEQPLSLDKRLSDLVRICNKMSPGGRDRFMKMYMDSLHRSFDWWLSVPFTIYDLKVILKRRFGRKAIKRLLSRD